MKGMKRLMLLAPLILAGCVFHTRPSGWIPARTPLTAESMAEMKRSGMSDPAIRQELNYHGLAYKLNADDLILLKQAGAGDALLSAAATAPVKTPQEARPIYNHHSHHCGYGCSHWAAPVYLAAGVGLGYLFGYWGHPYYYGCW